ncbi:hypothetical protein EDC14_1002217 [Hydrogenispora ethanolica]|uniref:Glycoside hydrolase family 127 protein n=1 Tax=Hydrogenispora ethanolica TaxID=1082276 RepID=A0A4R1SAI3_HYDET|nr:beta-L-arabinofuranosidase domain-containing protein [Hydrogenispora ethanolica]TCL76458.1 hypothetical protein EDC14_1002217 [Hydrogenispora ethanolica]
MTVNRQLDSKQRFWAIPHRAVQIEDRFWQPRIAGNRRHSLPYQYQQLQSSGVLDNFKRVLGQADGAYAGPFWMDSDAYKWLEAASYSLATHPDPELEQWVDDTIALIAAAQERDGYLDTYFQWVEPDKKFTNLAMCHELYCAGHLFQAAVAHFEATGRRTLLNVACRLADHIDAIFGPGKLEAADGHEEIETALVDLYRVTGTERYLNLAIFFIGQRGKADSRFRWELGHLDEIAGKPGKPGLVNPQYYGSDEQYDGRYAQDHQPVAEQSEVVGHAVRAMYLYSAMADIVAETGDPRLLAALERLWQNVTTRRMYITGGIGPSNRNEGFTRDYDLPNDTSYAETCAAVGMIMWQHRMLQLTGEGRFADIMERVLYNGFLSGVALDSRKFFYDNPMQSAGDRHRQGWFECACCPPNIARLLASLGKYLYSRCADGVAVHLYVQGSARVSLDQGDPLILHQTTDYPWGDRIQLRLELDRPAEFALRLRIPGWCRRHGLRVNEEAADPAVENGYAVLRRRWEPGDRVELSLEMPVERVAAHPAVWQTMGRVALQRGPLVYCLEEADHPVPVARIVLSKDARFTVRFDPELLGGIALIEGEGWVPELQGWENTLYRPAGAEESYRKIPIKAVPYYAWDNREPGSMAVWISQDLIKQG